MSGETLSLQSARHQNPKPLIKKRLRSSWLVFLMIPGKAGISAVVHTVLESIAEHRGPTLMGK
jgi:hypothetical protein